MAERHANNQRSWTQFGVMVVALTLGCSPLFAEQLYWDADFDATSNDASTGAGTGGSGVWDTGPGWWNPAQIIGPLGFPINEPWVNSNEGDAIFWGAAGTVTISGNVVARSLGFGTTGYALTGGTLSFGGVAGGGVNTGDVTVQSGVMARIGSQIGTGPVTKLGGGTLVLAGHNVYDEVTTVAQGVLRVSTSNAALGSAAGGTVVQDGAALHLEGGRIFTGEALTLSGEGVSGTGALYQLTANASLWGGPITLAADSSIGVATGGSLALTGGVGDSGNSYSLTKVGDGRLVISSATAYTGSTRVDAGTLRLDTANSLGGTSDVTVSGGLLMLNASDAIHDLTAVVVEDSGTFDTGTGGYSDTIASLLVNGTLTGNGTLNLGSVIFGSGATSTFTGTLNLTSQVVVDDALTGDVSVVGGTLVGTGSIRGGVLSLNGASVSPTGFGTFTVEDLVFGDNSSLTIDIAGASADSLHVHGDFLLSDLGTRLTFNVFGVPSLSRYTVLTFDGRALGALAFEFESGVPEGYFVEYAYTSGQEGGEVYLTQAVLPVPLPNGAWLGAIGLVAMATAGLTRRCHARLAV